MILHEQEGYGSGAQAVARRMRDGEIRLVAMEEGDDRGGVRGEQQSEER